MNFEKLESLLNEKDCCGRIDELSQYFIVLIRVSYRILEELVDISIKTKEENELNDMSVLVSFFEGISEIMPKYQREEHLLNEQIQNMTSQLVTQNESVNSLFNDLIPLMEYPLF